MTTELPGSAATEAVLEGFILEQTYEFQDLTYNAIGLSPWSNGKVVYMEFGRAAMLKIMCGNKKSLGEAFALK